MRTKRILPAMFAALLQVSIVFCQNAAADNNISKLKEYLRQFDKDNAPGLAISIVENGKNIFSGAYGLADLENCIPVKPDTMFDLASVAKSFTGIAIAMLADQNILSVTDDIRKYLPQIPCFGDTITIGHLLHHCSGLRDWVGALTLAGRTENDVILPRHIWNVVLNMKELNFKPGEKFSYSNTNYFLLAAIIEKVTGIPYPQWMKNNIFLPLGMKNTFVADNIDEIIPQRAKPYDKASLGKYKNMPSLLVSPGSSSIFSSADDLSKWLIDLQEHRIIGENIFNKLTECAIFNDGSEGYYGYGFEHRLFKGRPYIAHGGWWQGYRSKFAYFPKERLSIVALANSLDISPDKVVTDAAKIFFAMEDKPAAGVEEAKIPERVLMDAAHYDRFTGTYRIEKHADDCFTVMNVWREGDKYLMQCSGGFPVNEAIPISDTGFFTIPEKEYIYFTKDKAGDEFLIIRIQGKETRFIKTKVVPAKEQEKELSGIYYSDEIQTFYTLKIKDGSLVAAHFHNEDVVFKQILSNVFASDNVYFQIMEFMRGQDDHVKGFRLNGDSGRIKNLSFRKISGSDKIQQNK